MNHKTFVILLILLLTVVAFSEYAVLIFSGYSSQYTGNMGEYYQYPLIQTSFHQGDSLYISIASISTISASNISINHFSSDSTSLQIDFGTTPSTIILKDDGRNGDLFAGDGVYTGTFSIPSGISNGTICYVKHSATTIYKFIVDSSKPLFYSSDNYTNLFGNGESFYYKASVPGYDSPYYIDYSSLTNHIEVPTQLSTHITTITLSDSAFDPKNGVLKISNWSTITVKSLFVTINKKDIVYFNPKGEKVVISKNYVYLPYSSIHINSPSKINEYTVSAYKDQTSGNFHINVQNITNKTTIFSTVSSLFNNIINVKDDNLQLKIDFYDTSLIPTQTVEVCRFLTMPLKVGLATLQPICLNAKASLSSNLKFSLNQLNKSLVSFVVLDSAKKQIWSNTAAYPGGSLELSWNLTRNDTYSKVENGVYYSYLISSNFYGGGIIFPVKLYLNRYTSNKELNSMYISYSMFDTHGTFSILSNVENTTIDLIITDMSGFEVFHAQNIHLKTGITTSYVWDYTNLQNSRLPPGYYIAVIKSKDKSYSMIVGVK